MAKKYQNKTTTKKKVLQTKRGLYQAGLAAARIAVLAFNDVVIPALAILTVCCSITSCIAVRSDSSILSNSSIAQIPMSASTCTAQKILGPRLLSLACENGIFNYLYKRENLLV